MLSNGSALKSQDTKLKNKGKFRITLSNYKFYWAEEAGFQIIQHEHSTNGASFFPKMS